MPDDRDPETVASFRVQGLARYCFGNRWQFAVECELQDCERDPWGSLEPFGSFWMWVGGRVIGNTDQSEQLALAFMPLAAKARISGNRPDSRFQGMSNIDKLELVIWVRFGEDDDFDTKRWGMYDRERLRREGLSQYEVVPRADSPWCDGWEAILVERDTTETFIWRKWLGEAAEVQEVSLPRGMFASVAAQACQWFEPFRAERICLQSIATRRMVSVSRNAFNRANFSSGCWSRMGNLNYSK